MTPELFDTNKSTVLFDFKNRGHWFDTFWDVIEPFGVADLLSLAASAQLKICKPGLSVACHFKALSNDTSTTFIALLVPFLQRKEDRAREKRTKPKAYCQQKSEKRTSRKRFERGLPDRNASALTDWATEASHRRARSNPTYEPYSLNPTQLTDRSLLRMSTSCKVHFWDFLILGLERCLRARWKGLGETNSTVKQNPRYINIRRRDRRKKISRNGEKVTDMSPGGKIRIYKKKDFDLKNYWKLLTDVSSGCKHQNHEIWTKFFWTPKSRQPKAFYWELVGENRIW